MSQRLGEEEMNETRVQDLFDLTGRVAIVTGGGTGLGLRSAQSLAECGASVVIASRRLEVCQEAAKGIQPRPGSEVLARKLDVRRPEEVGPFFDEVRHQFGKVDILVNNSGTNRDALIDKADLDNWNEVIETNLTGTFLCSRAVAPIMIKERRGKIINIGSIYGVVGGVPALYTDLNMVWSGCSVAYAASKGAIIQMTRAMACYLAQWGIQVNCISPGGMDVGQVLDERFKQRYGERCPQGRMGKASEIKALVAFLASDASSYVNGQNIMLDGGWTAW